MCKPHRCALAAEAVVTVTTTTLGQNVDVDNIQVVVRLEKHSLNESTTAGTTTVPNSTEARALANTAEPAAHAQSVPFSKSVTNDVRAVLATCMRIFLLFIGLCFVQGVVESAEAKSSSADVRSVWATMRLLPPLIAAWHVLKMPVLQGWTSKREKAAQSEPSVVLVQLDAALEANGSKVRSKTGNVQAVCGQCEHGGRWLICLTYSTLKYRTWAEESRSTM